ncbi:MAG: hypothetical protein ACI83I_002609 [Bacteroidia bacterium]|jgi:hypothetical protein
MNNFTLSLSTGAKSNAPTSTLTIQRRAVLSPPFVKAILPLVNLTPFEQDPVLSLHYKL